MKRVIEISAKSQEEAQEMAKRELHPDEKIINSEILAAPAKGMFGIVGNPEFRIRFTIDAEPVREEAPPMVPERNYSSEQESEPLQTARSEHSVDEDESNFDEPDFERSSSERSHSNRKYSTELICSKHPMHDTIIDILNKAAATVGISSITFDERLHEDAWLIEAAGPNVSLFIGKHGKTLDSLQYVVNIIANKGREDKVKIVLDVQGYRDQRHRGLIALANRMFRKVLDTGRPVELEPMSTVDRRTVHIALKDQKGIETFSKGIEPLRRVVISPKNPRNRSWRPPRDGRPQNENRQPREEDNSSGSTRGKSVPMFMEDNSGEE